MRRLGEQWVEEIDGKSTCSRRWKVHAKDVTFHTCNLSADCHMERGLIAKDLGILNEDGLLPCPFCGEYPNYKRGAG